MENTPDCVRNNPRNGIIVQDYEGGEGHDNTLRHLASLVQLLCQSGCTVPDFLHSSKQLQLQTVAGELGDVEVYFLRTEFATEKVSHNNAQCVVRFTHCENQTVPARATTPAPSSA